MKFIKILLISVFLLSGCHQETVREVLERDPAYKVMLTFSERVRQETGLIHRGYGLNHALPKDYKFINGVANFCLDYSLSKKRGDEVTLGEARKLLVFVVENFLNTVNSDSKVTPMLDVCPLTSNLVKVSLHFEDENRIHLGQGIAIVYLWGGKLRYEGYNITEYTGKYPAVGKSYIIHEESYAEARKNVLQIN